MSAAPTSPTTPVTPAPARVVTLKHPSPKDERRFFRSEVRIAADAGKPKVIGGYGVVYDQISEDLGWFKEVVRPGAETGEVTAVFDLPADHPAREILAGAGLPAGDELILRRLSGADGRKTAFVNDRRAGAEVLRALSDTLVELHGQQDDRGLLDPRGHRAVLDAFAGIDTGPVRAAWGERRAAERALAEAEARIEAMRAEEDYLRHAVAELDRLSPLPGEEAELDTRRRQMQAGARIREDVARAAQALGPDGAERLMADAMRWLDGAAARAEGLLDEALEALGRGLTELGEAAQGVERTNRRIESFRLPRRISSITGRRPR